MVRVFWGYAHALIAYAGFCARSQSNYNKQLCVRMTGPGALCVVCPAVRGVGLQLRLLPLLLLLVLQVTGHSRLLETNPSLRCLIEMRNPYIDPINILQVSCCCRSNS
jgi:hypothetical protein